jgi:hypothetical protein
VFVIGDTFLPSLIFARKVGAGKPYWRGRISTVDLFVLNSLDQLLFTLKLYLSIFTKQPIIMRRSTVLSLPLQLVFPWLEATQCSTVIVGYGYLLHPQILD